LNRATQRNRIAIGWKTVTGVLSMIALTVITSVFLFVYLGAALMRPEWF